MRQLPPLLKPLAIAGAKITNQNQFLPDAVEAMFIAGRDDNRIARCRSALPGRGGARKQRQLLANARTTVSLAR